MLRVIFYQCPYKKTPSSIKLSLSEEAEGEDYFIQESAKAKELKVQIIATDKEIDRMVYQLFELTDEEIGMVENA